MQLTRFGLKLYADVSEDFSAERVIPVFHGFIRDHALDDVLVDVADYSHVHDGPGVVLIGHATDYYLDLSEGRPGLLFSRKREGPDGVFERLKDGFARALGACALLATQPALGLRFRTDEARLSVLDRLHAKNDDASLAALRPDLERALGAVYDSAPFELAREGSPKDLLTIRIRARGAPEVQQLLSRLEG
jgi:hypothetical protein